MNRRGYTIIEVATVLVILGTLGSTALPSFFSSQRRAKVRHGADEFVAAHSLAKAVALRYGSVAEIHIDAAGARFWVEVDTSVNRTRAMERIGTVSYMSDDGVTLTSTKAKLCFDGRGLATPILGCPPGNAKLVFSSGEYADSVVTTELGTVLR